MSRLIAPTPLVVVVRWSTRSQEQARRNAMSACTVLAARRLERLEVESFVAEQLAHRVATTAATAGEPVEALRGVG